MINISNMKKKLCSPWHHIAPEYQIKRASHLLYAIKPSHFVYMCRGFYHWHFCSLRITFFKYVHLSVLRMILFVVPKAKSLSHAYLWTYFGSKFQQLVSPMMRQVVQCHINHLYKIYSGAQLNISHPNDIYNGIWYLKLSFISLILVFPPTLIKIIFYA